MTTTIIGLSGSLRRGSYNTALLRAAAPLMPAGSALQVRTLHDIPLYDGDIEVGSGIPPGVVARGNPAQVIRPVSEKDLARWAWAKQLYIDLAKKYLDLGMEPVPDETCRGGQR